MVPGTVGGTLHTTVSEGISERGRMSPSTVDERRDDVYQRSYYIPTGAHLEPVASGVDERYAWRGMSPAFT